ncbi:hypothetical protein BS50DRAFT_604619 [Corynespora cassiicola Philippines]|uniref:Spherulation-specific family 4 n=1 Tax=Corynespora cassiicola Philippines TaxID=1448308 RepID=A0A2T2N5W7_CORCC|nr:hypothetical protein BS50DRAFT_604619 [Corynespora cassiicola Philippines]
MSILLPLYIYPWPGVWDPLYWAAGNNTNLNITVVVNPCSGPCLTGLPEAPYRTEIPKLKTYPNIRTLGYVATNWANKPIADLLSEIRRYAEWAAIMNDPSMAVDGIFFDETPGPYQWQSHDYLKVATDEVKGSQGLGQRLVVHNPGVLPDHTWNYLDLADITVIFEDTYAALLDAQRFHALRDFQNASKRPKSALAIMMHTIPNVPDELLDWVVGQMRDMVGWSFVSSIGEPGEYWHSFSNVFNNGSKSLKFLTSRGVEEGCNGP